MKKRIAIVTPGGIGAGINGQGFPALVQIVIRLASAYEVEIFSHALVTNKPENINFHFAPSWIPGSLLRWAYVKLSLIKNHFKKKYNVIFSFWGYPSGALAVLLGKLLNVPSIIYLLGGESANLPRINYGLMRKSFTRNLVLKTCRNASALMALSDFQVRNLKEQGLYRKIDIVPIGIDRNLFQKSERARGDVLRIIHVANVTPVKDQATLIRAFALIKTQINAHLQIVGPDYMNGAMQALAKELKADNDIEFTGWIAHTEIPDLMKKAHCFILTSLSEAQNEAITEAMMSGLLAVSTRVGVMADLGDEFGIVCDPGDHESLAKQLVSVFHDPMLWKKKTERSYAWAQEHDLEWTLEKIVSQIESLV